MVKTSPLIITTPIHHWCKPTGRHGHTKVRTSGGLKGHTHLKLALNLITDKYQEMRKKLSIRQLELDDKKSPPLLPPANVDMRIV